MSIKKVEFGRVDAESENNLAEYFVDTGVLKKLTSGRKYLVIGRKGSGKTALFKLATSEQLGHEVIALDFLNYPWEAHKMAQEAGLNAESAYLASWRFTFLAEVCRHWMDVAPSALRKQAAALMRRIYQDEEPGILEVLIDKFKRLRKVNAPEVAGVASGGGFELDAKAEPLLANALSRWCKIIEDLVVKNYDVAPFTLKLDRLDDGWDATEQSKQMLVGVLKAARDLNTKLHRPGKPRAVIVFLRSDLLNELRFNDKNKLSDDIEVLEWPDDKLIDVASARIARSLNCAQRVAWDRVFSADPMRQGARVSKYILKRTMGRPRDMIAFCLKCQDVAQTNIVETADVYQAEALYSRHIYDELDDEMHKQFPANRRVLQSLRALGKTRFNLGEWVETLRKTDPSTTEADARDQLKILFDYSIVGVPKKGGAQRGTRFQFNYNDRLVEPDFGAEMTVHPALKKELQLIEARRSEDDGDDEE